MMNSDWRRRSVALTCSLVLLASAACSRTAAGPSASPSKESFADGTPLSITPDLVSKAKAEGTVTVQYAASQKAMTATVAEFKKRYPGVEVVLERDSGASGGATMLKEFQAGEARVDVFGGSDVPTSLALSDAGAFVNLEPETMDAYPEEFRIAPGLYATSASTIVFGFNTTKVKPDEAQEVRDWSKVVGSNWRSRVAVSTPATSTGGLTLYYGWKHGGEDWLKGLQGLDPKLYDDTAPARDALVSGQTPLSVGQQEATMLQLVHNGAPVGFVYPNPTPEFQGNIYGVLSNAPHPNAAKLFWAWITGKEACDTLQKFPINQRCPMNGAKDIPDLPTDASWYAPIGETWIPGDEDWAEGLPKLQTTVDGIFGTP